MAGGHMKKNCKQCGKYFKCKFPADKYCSKRCREYGKWLVWKAWELKNRKSNKIDKSQITDDK